MLDWLINDFNIFDFYVFKFLWVNLIDGTLFAWLIYLTVFIVTFKILYYLGLFTPLKTVALTLFKVLFTLIKLSYSLILMFYILILFFIYSLRHKNSMFKYWFNKKIDVLGITIVDNSDKEIKILHPKIVSMILNIYLQIKEQFNILKIAYTNVKTNT